MGDGKSAEVREAIGVAGVLVCPVLQPSARNICNSITYCYIMSKINSKSFVCCELMEGARVGALAMKGKAKPVPLKPNRKTHLFKN